MKHSKNRKLTRRGISFLLALVLMASAFAPGAAYATEGFGPARKQVSSKEIVDEPEETLVPETTVPERVPTETTAPAETVPGETVEEVIDAAAAYGQAIADLEALEAEAKTLALGLDPESEDYVNQLEPIIDEFYTRLTDAYTGVFDLWEANAITAEEWNAFDAKFQTIVKFLEDTYGYKDGRISSFVEVDSVEAANVTGVDVKLFNYGPEINSHPDIIHNPNADPEKLADTSKLYGRYEFYNTYNDAKDGKVTEDNVYRPNYDDKNQTLSHTNLRPMKTNSSYSGGKFPEQDFDVAPLLKNGYPELTSWPATQNPTSFGTMAYLFQEGAAGQNGVTHVATMKEGGGLFQLDQDGYYEYHAQKNAAYYDEDTNKFILSQAVLRPSYYADKEWSDGAYNMGHFLPFNSIEEVTDGNTLKTSTNGIASYALPNVKESLDMWFGMTVEFNFVMTKDGKVQDANGDFQDMTFMFEGDDDVLVYVDDVLILNIAGMHSPQDAWVNFATGEIYDQHVSNSGTLPDARTTIKERFAEAGKTDASLFNGETFADYTTHTLKFFYLERGSSLAGCRLRFNLQTLPENSVSVSKSVKNDANPNAKAFSFQVELADASGNALTTAPYTRSDGTSGELSLTGGVGKFNLKNNEMITFNLNAGVTYKVRELSANQNNYVTTVSGQEEGSLSGAPVLVSYTNTLETGGIERDKYVTEGDTLGDYTIHLEAYATGQISSISKAKPTDIVIAFDHSGSMLRALDYDNGKMTDMDALDKEKGSIPGYYIAHGSTQTVFLLWKDNKWCYVGVNEALGMTGSKENEAYNAKGFNIEFNSSYFTSNLSDATPYLGNFETYGIWQTRFGAAYDALHTFVDKVAETGVDHNIALVTFSGNAPKATGVYSGGTFHKYTDSLSDSVYKNAFMSVENQKDMILACVADLYSGWGNTFMGSGLTMVDNIFTNNPITDNSRDRMVVVVNDGLPQQQDVAMDMAAKLKDNQKAKIYSIGALASSETAGITLLEKISSNYNSAGTKVNDKYFVNATNADTMNNMFDQIVTDTSGTQVALDEYSILRDTISEYFLLDEDVSDIKVYTAACTGQDENGLTWAEPVGWTQGTHLVINGTPCCDSGCAQPLTVTVDGQQIDVKGFDYSLNYVAATGANSGRGHKLIVEIPVTMAESNQGGTYQPTNDPEDTGIYDEEEKVTDFPLPHVDTPVKVTVEKQVTGNMGDWSKDFSFTVNGVRYVDADKTVGDSYNNTADTAVGSSNYLVAKGEDFDDTITLKHDQEKVYLDIKEGYLDGNGKLERTSITIQEKDYAPYELSVTVNGVTQTHTEGSVTIPVTPGMKIVFTNHNQADIDTGVVLDSLPYILILGGVAAVAVFLFLRRRSRYDD